MVRVRCTYCGSTWNIESDHLIANSKGGVITVPACQYCNRSKQNKSRGEWLDWIKENNPYRWRKIKEFQKGKRSEFARMVRDRS